MILEIKNGCFGYPKQDIILSDINLSLEEGHILAILGPNGISYIPQSHGFAFSYTGLEMVMLGRCSHLGVFEQPGRREIEMAEAMMEKTGITHLAKKDCNRMSGGELQMVLIARALINEPKLIILDEPETGLDFHNQILVLNMTGSPTRTASAQS